MSRYETQEPRSLTSLHGSVALITGAAKGIGYGCARILGRAGAAIASVDTDAPALQQSIRSLRKEGIHADAFVADVGRADDVDATVNAVVAQFGGISILINNAGTHDGKGIEEASEADWDRIITTNLKSVFLITKASLPHLKRSQGTIINMASMVAIVGQTQSGAYSASKGGIVALTKSMALDFASYGIRVNCICPGWVQTPLVDAWFAHQTNESAARRYVDSIHPLGRIATPEDIGQIALFLATSPSSFVTGVALTADGGVTLGY
ncbi:MAG: SDR family oxidoreductase [Caldilineaceae bacterium]|nr:SDR family oxidoreductase [Caldilineaceae bacterium]